MGACEVVEQILSGSTTVKGVMDVHVSENLVKTSQDSRVSKEGMTTVPASRKPVTQYRPGSCVRLKKNGKV